jgi:carbonic anhydrase
MKKNSLCLTVMLFASSSAFAAGGAHWTYSGHEGPENWAKLSAEFSGCSGRNQSPIDLSGFIEADLAPIRFSYQAGSKEILNNGHTVQVNYAEGSSIQIDGMTFNLLQFHFHAPSENNIEGKSYPMEAHFVHADKDGNLAVVALMFEEGAENKALAKAWAQMPKHAGDKHAFKAALDAGELLPADRDYYRFNGSLTTPPCTEGVRWLVLKNPVTASKQQIAAFSSVLHEPNNRPLQAVNARPILK